ncbi:hypothetical protein B0H13DRAFT_2477750 [Mycena leptocephala]|nr:hypothetical protein B0H13DRAFT_2477750 [Mycena leptocephala]
MSNMSCNVRPQSALNNQLVPLEAFMANTVSTRGTKWDWMRSIRQTESLQLMNTNLNSFAIIATFLAGVQAQAISFSLDQQDTNLQIACNALFFGGLFIDVLSGTIAIVGAIQLQRTYTLLQQWESALMSLSEVLKDTAQSAKEFQRDNLALAHHLRFLKMIVFRLLQSPRLWNELSSQLKKSADLAEDILRESNLDDVDRITVSYSLADYRYTTTTAFRTSLGFAASLTAPWPVLAGLCSFTAGVVCLVLYSEPLAVWATSFAVLGGTGFVLFSVLAVIIGVDPRPVTLPFPNA